jgi:putative oxidoreductase
VLSEGESMSYGLLLLRVVVGVIFAAHGAQKLFGWFEGPGAAGTRGWIGGMGFRPAWLFAGLVSLQELGGGVLLALGLLTPLGSLAVTASMVVAVTLVPWKNGFFVGKGGYEFNLALAAAAVALAATGPGRFSIDRALGIDDNLSGLWWGVGVVAVAFAGGFLAIASRKKDAVPGT